MFYEKYCARIISDIIQVVVAVGLITILANYIRCAINDPAITSEFSFWLRCLLLLLTITFTSYHLLGFTVDTEAIKDELTKRRARRPVTIIFLYMIDLAAIGALAGMFGVLTVGDGATANDFIFEWKHLSWLAILAAVWHALMVIWHLVAMSPLTVCCTHFLFGIAFSALYLTASLPGMLDKLAIGQPALMLVWAALFGTVIFLLYFTRARHLLKVALTEKTSGG